MKALSSSKKPSSKLIIGGIVVIVLLVSAGIYAYLVNKNQQDIDNHNTSTIKEEQVTEEAKSKSTLPSKEGPKTAPSGQSSTEAPSTPPEKPAIERAGGDPTIKVVASFQASSSGHCELQLSKPGSRTLSYTSDIVISTSYYTCSFAIERSSLPSSGVWVATVLHHLGAASTPSDTKEIR